MENRGWGLYQKLRSGISNLRRTAPVSVSAMELALQSWLHKRTRTTSAATADVPTCVRVQERAALRKNEMIRWPTA
jgi:hypothetical protein